MGFVHLPRDAYWLADYLHELTVFPNGRYDDQVDSTSQALTKLCKISIERLLPQRQRETAPFSSPNKHENL
jgi:phage terminase large subunit-like protein